MAKKKKKKGPIRTEAIIPIAIVIILFGLYFKYFFDSHLRRGIEYGATMAHGAEVNLGGLTTDFLAPAIYLSNIQVTDKSQPEFNIVRIGQVRLKLLWDGLLRGKFVIPESSILEIQAKSKRARPGRVIPPSKKSNQKGEVEKAAEKTISQLQEKNKQNLLSDIFAVVGGTDYKQQLKNMEGQLQSKQKIKKLETELKAKEAEWKKKIDELPDESEIKQLVKKVEKMKFDTSSPKKIQDSIKKADAVYKEARQKYKTVETAKKAFSADMKKYDQEYKNLEKMINDDIAGIGAKLNIPSLDPKEINQMLLGNLVAAQLGHLYKYKKMAEEYLPSKSPQERKTDKQSMQLTPTERAKGVNYRFPKEKSYPRFWLKKAVLSSDSKKGQAGDVKGTLQNFTNNPKHLGLPATIDFQGGFPHQQISDVVGNIIIDHTTDQPFERGQLSVGHFPVEGNTLSESKDVELGYKKADGSSKIAFLMKEGSLELQSNSLFSNVAYYSKAADKRVNRMLKGVTQGLDNLTLNVRAKGSWDDLGLNINSNLGKKLSDAIKAQVSGEIKRAKKEVEQHVRGLVGKEKGKVKQEIAKIEKKLGLSLKSREDAVNSVKKKVDEKKKQATNKKKKKIEKKAKKEIKKLLKDLKF